MQLVDILLQARKMSSVFPLPVFGFDGETLLSGSHVKYTCAQRFNPPGRMSSLSTLAALQTCQSNEDNRPSIHRLPRRNRHGCPDELLQS